MLGVWLNFVAGHGGNAVNAGLFGATLDVPAGLWLILLSALWLWAALLVVRELPARH